MIKRQAERRLSTRFGNWQEILYRHGKREIVVLLLGEVREEVEVPCRIHSSCLSAHVLNSIECDCREQMEIAQSYIAANGRGVVIVLEQEGKGNGHQALMLATRMASEKSISQDQAYCLLGFDPPDSRDYTGAAEVLADLGVSSIELLTNNPDKESQLRKANISVVRTTQVALDVKLYPQLRRYYDDKAKLGHYVYVRPGASDRNFGTQGAAQPGSCQQ